MDEDKAKVTQAQAIKHLSDNWPMQVEGIAICARLTRAKYLALMREGFTASEALFLCK
jgi:hypothetical protein